MTTQLPLDMNNNAIPALRLRNDGAHVIAAASSSARNATAFADDTKIISVYASVPVYINMGGADVTASTSDHYYPAGLYYDFAIGDEHSGHASHVAILRVESDGNVYISEKF